MTSYKRRNKFPKPRYQFQFGVAFATAALVAILVQAFLLNLTLREIAAGLVSDELAMLETWPEAFLSNILTSIAIIVPASLAVGMLTVFRVAGPLRRLENHMTSFLNGEDLGECRLRSGDQLVEFCSTINKVMDRARAADLPATGVRQIDDSQELEQAA